MINLKKLLLLLCLVFLSACGTSMKYTKDEFMKKEKGVAFLDVQLGKFSMTYKINKYGSNKELEIYKGTYSVLQDNRNYLKKMLFLEPGIYSISYIDLSSSFFSDDVWLPGPGIKDDRVVYGAFEVKAGEVISLGVLKLKEKKAKGGSWYKADIEDNFSILKSQLQDSDKAYLEPILKKGVFYKRGSWLIKDNSQNINIMPIEEIKKQRKNLIQEVTRRLEDAEK